MAMGVGIKVQLTRKPGELDYKCELIRKTHHIPVKDIIAFAEAQEVTLTREYIYTQRCSDKKRAKVAPKLLPAPALRLTPANGAPKTVVKFTAFENQREKDFLRLFIEVGLTRSMKLIETTFKRNLGSKPRVAPARRPHILS